MKIAVAGTGYVGLSIATLLSQHHEVMAVDIIPEKVDLINHKKSPIQDEYIEKYLAEKDLNLTATLDAEAAYKDADFVVIAAPTNYDSKKNFFDTSAVEAVIKLVEVYAANAKPGERYGEWIDRIGWEKFFRLTDLPFTDKHIDDFIFAQTTFRSTTQFRY